MVFAKTFLIHSLQFLFLEAKASKHPLWYNAFFTDIAGHGDMLLLRKSCIYAAKLLQLCPTLCNPMDCNCPPHRPGSVRGSVHGILQARILEWVAMPSSRGSSWPSDQTCISYVSCIGRQVLYHWATWEVQSSVYSSLNFQLTI